MSNKTKRTAADIHKAIADKVIASMKQHGTDWVKSWSVPKGDQPTSMSTGNTYNGINWLVLGMARAARGYKTGRWATYNQWKTLGANVRKGEKGELVVLFKQIKIEDKESGEEKMVPLMRGFTVFNADQVDGYTIPETEAAQLVDMPDTVADDVAQRAGVVVENKDASGAYYVPSKDFVNMPLQAQFNSPEDYAATLLHEVTHWTGHQTRCDRNLKTGFGTKDYAAEELVAELGAAMLCGSLGISPEPRADHAKYLNGWIQRLTDDPKAIFTAAAKAQVAADFILNAANVSADQLAEAA